MYILLSAESLNIYGVINMKRTIIVTAVMMLSALSFNAQEASLVLENGVKGHKEIDSIYRTLSEAYQTLDAELTAKLYTNDAAYLVPDKEISYGNDNISKSFKEFFQTVKAADRKMSIGFRVFQRKVEGDIGYDVGEYLVRFHKNERMLGEFRGKFVVVVVRGEDGVWRFQVDGFSDIKPGKS